MANLRQGCISNNVGKVEKIKDWTKSIIVDYNIDFSGKEMITGILKIHTTIKVKKEKETITVASEINGGIKTVHKSPESYSRLINHVTRVLDDNKGHYPVKIEFLNPKIVGVTS